MNGGRGLPLGCAAVALVLVASSSSPARAQFFSPGPLARPHAALEGLERCSKCHEEQKGLSARLCLDCHTELAGRVAKGTGFHGRLPAAKKQECQSCHPDHRGLDFSMIEWEGGRDKFDHRKTGWPLKGGHTKARCDDCHQRRLIVDPAIRHLFDQQPRRATLLGAAARCDGCHFDEHRGQLARDCQKCHDEAAWKPAPTFDHQATTYPLLGKHRDVACAKCHPAANDERTPANAFPKPRAAAFMQMKPIDHKTCESCHDDPHNGSLGPACSSCHSEAGWKLIKSAKGQDTGFHDKTRFPLRGGHIGVACRSCHGPFPGQAARFKGLAFGACSDCHQDAHLGQLRPKPPAKVVACDGCHTVNAFAPVRYELEQHQTTRFPLEGAHGMVACRGCHPIDDALAARIPAGVRQTLRARRRPERFSFAVLRPKKSPQACLGCHEDVHRGQFAEAGNKIGDNCAECHQTKSFADLTFDHDKDSRFPLTGKHARTACAACHKPQRIGAGPGTAAAPATAIRYKPLDLGCGSCHADYHQGQFVLARPLGRQAGAALVSAVAATATVTATVTATATATPPKRAKARDCDFCHPTSGFKQTLFDHNDARFTSYALDGRHARVDCARCHPTVVVAPEVQTVRYRPLPRACEDCHVDFHHGEFRGFEP
jgi:hypothetical protein